MTRERSVLVHVIGEHVGTPPSGAQRLLGGHRNPQAPQLFGSSCKLVQVPLQLVGVGSTQTQLVPEHCPFTGHVTQAPPQLVRPGGQTQAPLEQL